MQNSCTPSPPAPRTRKPTPVAPKTRISPPQEIYAVTGGCARGKICQKNAKWRQSSNKWMGTYLHQRRLLGLWKPGPCDWAGLPDNDLIGKKHSLQAANSLFNVAGEIRIVQLPSLASKEDISNWLDMVIAKNNCRYSREFLTSRWNYVIMRLEACRSVSVKCIW